MDFWSRPIDAVTGELGTSPDQGLGAEEATRRAEALLGQRLATGRKHVRLRLLLAQFKSPILLILVACAVLALTVGERTDGVMILVILTASALLGFWQEQKAAGTVAALLARVTTLASVRRGGHDVQVPIDAVVPGDILVLKAGDSIAGDARIVEANHLLVDEAALTGESLPADKLPGDVGAKTTLTERSNSLFLGTHVVSGSALAVVAHIGRDTEFGRIAEHLDRAPPETDFEHGVRHFGYLLMEVTLILVILIFAVNVALHRPVLDALLFSLALAVGLTPQLLPAIISVNLAHGARRMAANKVIVKRLSSIENFGSMDVLCSDKTGTLTEGKVQLHAAFGLDGKPDAEVARLAWLNAALQSGFENPIDAALKAGLPAVADAKRLSEVPYDFTRKRLSVLVQQGDETLLVTKGAIANVLAVCTKARRGDGSEAPIASVQAELQAKIEAFSSQGLRTIGIAVRRADLPAQPTPADEAGMTFCGVVTLEDPLKPGIEATIAELARIGVSLRMITGDNRWIAGSIGAKLGLDVTHVLTGAEVQQLSEPALRHKVGRVRVFAEIEPNQKERILAAFRASGHVVGYVGDGINDASALHTADVGISVDTAVDVAKDAADIVLLEKDLGVLIEGVREGRKTFANTMKYVFMATSANFGNMFSMAGASLLLPFLPLLPGQVLLMNLLTDLPEMTIATDAVDEDLLQKPQRWDLHFIRRFMIWFGLLSSVFDYLTFATLHFLLRAPAVLFRTGWFVESVCSAALVVLVVRTRKRSWRSRPGPLLLGTTLAVLAAVVLLPLLPTDSLFGFTPLPWFFYVVLAGLLAAYALSAELLKARFYKTHVRRHPRVHGLEETHVRWAGRTSTRRQR